MGAIAKSMFCLVGICVLLVMLMFNDSYVTSGNAQEKK